MVPGKHDSKWHARVRRGGALPQPRDFRAERRRIRELDRGEQCEETNEMTAKAEGREDLRASEEGNEGGER